MIPEIDCNDLEPDWDEVDHCARMSHGLQMADTKNIQGILLE